MSLILCLSFSNPTRSHILNFVKYIGFQSVFCWEIRNTSKTWGIVLFFFFLLFLPGNVLCYNSVPQRSRLKNTVHTYVRGFSKRKRKKIFFSKCQSGLVTVEIFNMENRVPRLYSLIV